MPEIIYSKKIDLPKLAECHRSAFPDSLSSRMGKKYLEEMIAWYLSDSSKILFHAEVDGRCIGYCGGMILDGTQPTGSASGMMQYSFNSAVKAIMLRPWLLVHKEFLNKYKLIYKNIKRKFSGKKKQSEALKKKKKKELPEKEMGLVVIGVSSDYHGKGIGSVLLQEFENKTKSMDIKKMGLAVRRENEKALKSYQRNGWEISKEHPGYFEMTKRIL
ncbi:MAG TPA: GNAT family N-acetyltransferase [Ignavibacteria bacterium]|nr:GNAT family N-acetyltransferase [Ignavibacteria bacterium]HMR38798.1 GNAT family N-acetyltransferase [Ignavibacteria bacterium]